jgi:hypothetical protein
MRSGLWSKYRINLGQEFVIGGYIPSNLGVDSLVAIEGKDLIYSARVRAGLLPATRREVFVKLRHLKTAKCPFVNLPELAQGRWGQGLTAEKRKECVWLKPEAVARIEFLEWRALTIYAIQSSLVCETTRTRARSFVRREQSVSIFTIESHFTAQVLSRSCYCAAP